MSSAVPSGFRASTGSAIRRAQRHDSRGDRLDRGEHDRPRAARARALPRRSGQRQHQRGFARGARACARGALCGGRRSQRLFGAQGCARRQRHRRRGRRERASRSGAASGPMGDRRDHRRGRPAAHAGGRRARRDRGARQQRVPGLCRRAVHAARCGRGRDRAAGRFRAQRSVPVDGRQPPRRPAARHPHGLRRSIPDLDGGRHRGRHARAGAQAPELVDGPEGHDRFGDADEQGARGDRGAPPVSPCHRPRSTSSSILSRSSTAWSSSATAR